MLREIAHLDAAADRHGALVRLARARDELEQCRFAGAVDAHHAPALPAADHEIEPVIDPLAAVALEDLFEHNAVLARARRRWEVERHRLAAARRLHPLDLVELLHPALNL